MPNPDQSDSDQNGVGDACALCSPFDDFDGDNVCNSVDNCPFTRNVDQADGDGDGFGNVCDGCPGPGPSDSDADGICDGQDNCTFGPNPNQADGDGDLFGDVCDNCPAVANTDQANGDGDALGDLCDHCLDDPTNLCVPAPPATAASCTPLQIGGSAGWTTKAPMPVGRSGAAGVVIGDRVYVTHGNGFPVGEDTTNQIYDRTTDTWYGGTRAGLARSELTAVCIEDASGQGLVFAVGGQAFGGPLADVELYNPFTNSWSAGPPMPTARRGLGAAFVPGAGVAGGNRGTVYVVGGTLGGAPLAVNEAFDVQLGVWMTRASIPIPVMQVASTTYVPQTGRIYVIGGYDGSFLSSAVQIYDPVSDTWSQGAPMPTARTALVSGLCGSRIYAIGGYSGGSTNESYDPLTNTWRPEPHKPIPAMDLASQSISTGREIYALGGRDPFVFGTQPFNEVFTCAGPSCDVTPLPKSAGYYKKLCKNGHGHPHGGDALTDFDAVCVGQLTATFAGISTVDEICDVIDSGHDRDSQHDDHSEKECDKGEDELMALALNLCRQRVCQDQDVDSECSGGPHNHTLTTVSASLATADAILADPSRNRDTCKNAKCLAKEINNGHGLHHTSLRLDKETGGKVRLSWESPVMDDGSGEASSYTVWRRALGANVAFVQIATTSESSFVDRAAAAGNWEYEVTFTIDP